MNHDLDSLKETFLIEHAWCRLGLPGVPATSCRSPFREDRKPSFSIYDGGKRWKDFSTGEGGDVIDFISRACNVENAEAVRRFLVMTGVPIEVPASVRQKRSSDGLQMPPVRNGDADEIERLARLRHIHPDAVSLAQSLRTLRFGNVCAFPSWILTDASNKLAEARRMDGKIYPEFAEIGERKAHTIKGSSKSWPCGVSVVGNGQSWRAVLVVEGGPDYLAALHFAVLGDAWDLIPVAMLGREAGSRIDPAAIEILKGRRIRIYPHDDADGGGEKRAEAWAEQFMAVGCEVDQFLFAGLTKGNHDPIKDLNDATQIHPDQKSQLQNLLP